MVMYPIKVSSTGDLYRQDISINNKFKLTADEPLDLGGNDRGATPKKDAIWTCFAGQKPIYHRNRQVAETYLQNCDAIWICAPIKRAVDDGTAKELLGEQFKRRLLMDGMYHAVSFVCTQTDDVVCQKNFDRYA